MMWLYRLHARIEKRLFPERSRRWRRWKQHDAASPATIAHDRFDEFLAAHVVRGEDGVNRVRYGDVSPPARASLDAYVAECESLPISTYRRDEQFAYWLNMYNAVTLRTIIAHYPVRSARNIGVVPSFLGGGPWNRPRVSVEGHALSLNDIEHRILRRNFRDPRIHFAVNCGAVGCPDLPMRAFRGEGLSATLDRLACEFIESPRGVDVMHGKLSLCRIFSWFREDFGTTEPAVLEYLRAHGGTGAAPKLDGRARVDRYHYNWALNDAR